MEFQLLLDSDIVIDFDECTKNAATHDEAAASMERSMRWAKRSRDAFDGGGSHAERAALFGIQQGALDEGLRRVSADRLIDIGRSEEHTSELQSLMRISYAVFCLKKKKKRKNIKRTRKNITDRVIC